MKKNPIDAREVRAHAADRWIEILGAVAPALEPALSHPGRHVPCPVHGGKDGFRLFRDVDRTGGGVCNTCGSFHDGFALLMWV
ncbi:MAG: primase-helicase zinc-binding domain-containing protein, partial [Gemmatimonadota bacterium]